MAQNLIFPLLAVVILCFASYNRDSYQLDWSHTEVQARAKQTEAPPAPVPRTRLPERPLPPSPRVGPLPVLQRSFQLRVSVRHFFDFQKDRYVLVDHVQTTIYRKRGYNTETHWNTGHNPQLDLVLNNLSPGDRYQIEVIWDDGSRRWFDNFVGRTQPARLYVDEPDPFQR